MKWQLFIVMSLASLMIGVDSNAQHPINNQLDKIQDTDLAGFKWMNTPKDFSITDGVLSITAEKNTDFFINPVDTAIGATAPLLYQVVYGDFVAITQVRPDFSSQWNACALMVYIDSLNWIKFAFEDSDATGKSIVSVVTKGVSDDANGAVLNDQETVWLKMVRKGDLYSMHWSIDGNDYKMARLTAMPPAGTVRVGMEAQSPVGEAVTHEFLYFSLEEKTVKDLRKGE